MKQVLLYITAESREEAVRLGRVLVEERLAACANVLTGMTSVYRWQGQVQEEGEAVLIVKTQADLADRATARIKALHRYDCPCVVVLPIAGGNEEFLQWIVSETS